MDWRGLIMDYDEIYEEARTLTRNVRYYFYEWRRTLNDDVKVKYDEAIEIWEEFVKEHGNELTHEDRVYFGIEEE